MKKYLFILIVAIFFLSSCNLPVNNRQQDQLAGEPLTIDIDGSKDEPSDQNSEITDTAVKSGSSESDTASVSDNSQAEEVHLSAEKAVLLFTIGMHVEPFGETAQGFGGNNKGNYEDEVFFNQHVENIRNVAEIVAAHGGVMTVQVQSPFTEKVIATNDPILRDLKEIGFEIAFHFHEDAHLGKNSSALSEKKWCEVMKQEINLIKIASGVKKINYWSGGNVYPMVFQAADCAGLSVNSDWKNPETQSTDMSLQGIHPWRPAGGTDGQDFSLISVNDPNGKIIFLPEGQFDREDIMAIKQSDASGGEEAYFAYLEQSLINSLEMASADQVNVFHFTIHPTEFRGDPKEPFMMIDQFLRDVIDPLVASGQVQWATYSQMADTYREWEMTNPGKAPRN